MLVVFRRPNITSAGGLCLGEFCLGECDLSVTVCGWPRFWRAYRTGVCGVRCGRCGSRVVDGCALRPDRKCL